MKLVKKLVFVFVLAVLLLLANLKWEEKSVQADHEGGVTSWYDSAWQYRKHIVIDETQVAGSSDFADFPVLINLSTDSELAANAQDDGDDLVFTSSDGVTKLNHELEAFDGSTGKLTAWVNVPTLLAAANTEVFIYYGNTEATSQQSVTGTWNSNYSMVHHFSETSGQHIDSTINNNDTDSVTVTTQGTAESKMGGADRVIGNPDLITIPDNANNSLDKTEGFSLSVWVKPDEFNSTYQAIFYKGITAGSPRNYGIFITNVNTFLMTWFSGNWREFATETSLVADSWNHLVYTRDATHDNLYLNGVNVSTWTIVAGIEANDEKIYIGYEASNIFRGNIDEFRIVDTALTADWLATEHANQNDPSSFYTLGTEETDPNASSEPPTISLTALSPDPSIDTTPSLAGTATDTDGTIGSVEYQVDSTSGSWSACVADDGAFDEASEAFTCTVSSALTDGSHTLYVRSTDNASNVSEPSSDAFVVDITAPSLSLTTISPDPTTDSTPVLTGTATDQTTTVASVQFQMNGTGGSWTACVADDGAFDEASEAFTCTVDSALADGSNSMHVQTADVVSNTSSPSSDTFEVDTAGPEVSLTAVSPDPITDTTPTVSGIATDTHGTVASVEYQVDSTSGSWAACVATDGAFDEASEAFTCTVSELADGAHTIYVRATDVLGTISSSNATDIFTVDSLAPSITLAPVSPDPGTDTTPAITGEATDAVGTVTAVDFQVDSTAGAWSSCTADDGTFDEASEEFTCTSTELSDGDHSIYVRATDNASNTASPDSDTFTVDTTAPSLSLTAISPDPGTDGTPVLTGTATDVTTTVNSVQFQMNGTAGTWTNCSATDGSFNEASEEFSCSVATVLDDGSHEINVRALDVVGNVSNPSSDSFDIDSTGPVVSLTPLSPDPNSDTTPTLSGSVTEGTTAVTSVEYQVDSTSGSWSACSATDSTFDEASEAFTCTVASALSDGSHTVYVRSADELGNSSSTVSDVFSIDTTSPVISSVSVTPNDTSVIITWSTNENGSSKVDYGLSTAYGETTLETDTSPRVTAHSVTVSSLATCTTYHYRVRSIDALSHETVGAGSSFTTSGCTGSAVVVSQTTEEVTTASGGTVGLVSGGTGITLDIPADFATDDANFQIKQLNQNSVLNSTSLPAGYVLASVHLYDLKALTDTATVLSSFDEELTVTINYEASDILDIIETTLTLYRWDGSAWHQLTNCSLDTDVNTISCSTSEFSVFGLFGEEDPDVDEPEEEQNDDDNDSSSSNSSSTSDACTKASPGIKAAWIYGALTKGSSSIELNFTPADEPVTKYVLQYGTKSGDYSYGVQDLQVNSREQMKYLVQSLSPNTTYYFRVRASNGCATGAWSNEIVAKTSGLVGLNQLEFTDSTLEVVPPVVDTSPSSDASGDATEQSDENKYTVSIKVLNDQDNPVEGAKVTIHSEVQEGYSDKNGLVTFNNVEKGGHRVIIAYQGYEGEQAINLDGESEEVSLTIHIKAQNVYLSPQFIFAMSISSVIIITLLILLWKKSK